MRTTRSLKLLILWKCEKTMRGEKVTTVTRMEQNNNSEEDDAFPATVGTFEA